MNLYRKRLLRSIVLSDGAGTLEERSASVESLKGVHTTQERLLSERGEALEKTRIEAESLRLQVKSKSQGIAFCSCIRNRRRALHLRVKK